jgi:hypothetical protein
MAYSSFLECDGTYIGGPDDIYPSIWRGPGHGFWYMSEQYFSIACHSLHVGGIYLEVRPTSYIRYLHSDGQLRVAQVLYCLLQSNSGQSLLLA